MFQVCFVIKQNQDNVNILIMEMGSRAESIIAELNTIKDRMYDLGVKLKNIDRKSGEQVLAVVATMALNSGGIPIQLPKEMGYWALGIFGIALDFLKRKKIKPIAAEITQLEKKYNSLVNEYQAILETDSYKTVVETNQIKIATAGKGTSGATPTNSTSNTNLLWGSVILAFLIGIYFYFRRRNAVTF